MEVAVQERLYQGLTCALPCGLEIRVLSAHFVSSYLCFLPPPLDLTRSLELRRELLTTQVPAHVLEGEGLEH